MSTMLAARYLGPDRIEVEEVSIPDIGEEEALVEVDACGFCGSDISIVAGTHPRARAPLTVGHELSGRVVKLRSSQSDLHVGDQVTTYPLISCGSCYACTHGSAHVCRHLRLFGFDVDGGMAEFVRLPVSSLLRLPKELPSVVGALIEPLAVAVHGVGRVPVQHASAVAVLGAGPIGLLTALVARARGVPHVIVSDVLPARLQLAKSLGFEVATAGEPMRSKIMALTEQNGADIIFECAGHQSSAREMTTLTRPRGTVVNLSVFKRPVEIDMQAINFKEIELLGSRVYERKDFEYAIALAPQLPLQTIVTHTFLLKNVTAAFEQFRSGNVCKVMVLPRQVAS